MPDLDVTVSQSGNRFDIAFDTRSLLFEVTGIELEPTQPDFAVWALLPFALRQGGRLRLHFPVDPVVLANARELARLWTMWLPEMYYPFEIEADEERVPPPSTAKRSAMLFSGGVDSTFSMLRQLAADDPAQPLTHAVTVHGMNHFYANPAALDGLTKLTDPLLERHGLKRIVVRTDVGAKLRRIGMIHAFLLGSSLFTLSRSFSRGFIAADITAAQDFLAFPWGTNHISNALFAGSHFRMETLSQDVTRIWKLDYLRRDPLAMKSIHFCGDKSKQPLNCGVCSKCLRTKVMFMALDGTSPDIFMEPGVTAQQIGRLDVSSNAAFKHYYEILEVAQKRGTIGALPGIEAKMRAGIAKRRTRFLLAKAWRETRMALAKYRLF